MADALASGVSEHSLMGVQIPPSASGARREARIALHASHVDPGRRRNIMVAKAGASSETRNPIALQGGIVKRTAMLLAVLALVPVLAQAGHRVMVCEEFTRTS